MDFLALTVSFPTAIFSVLLIVVILFWLVALLGFVDIDIFESDVEIETEASTTSTSNLASLWQFGFGSLPISVSLSLVILVSWLINIYVHFFFSYLLGDGILFYIFGVLMLVASALFALPLAAIISQPLHRFFESRESANKHDFLGLECTVVTGTVTPTFGQAKIQFEGTEQLINVITAQDEIFKSGDTAVLLEYHQDKNCYSIIAKPW